MKNVKFVVTEKRIVGVYDDRDEAWDYLDKCKKENPDGEFEWHVEYIKD